MKHSKKISKLLMMAMITMSVSSIGMYTANAAGNYKDTEFNLYFNGEGIGRFTPVREKEDYTSSYVYNTNSDCALKVNVWSAEADGGLRANCSVDEYKQVNIGVSAYLPNYVKENGYNYASLFLQPVTGTGVSCYMRGLWSPDSI